MKYRNLPLFAVGAFWSALAVDGTEATAICRDRCLSTAGVRWAKKN